MSPSELLTKNGLVILADTLLSSVRPFASANHAFIIPSTTPSLSCLATDGFEGFAHTFLLASFRLVGANGRDPTGLIDWYASGLSAGTDPHRNERWPKLSDSDQSRTGAALIALSLDLTRPWLWDQLDDQTQQQIIDFLKPCLKVEYRPNHYLWFRIITQTFLRSVGAPFSANILIDDLAHIDSFESETGWYSDGPGHNFDQYCVWTMHFYPALWRRMRGAEEFATQRETHDRESLDRFLTDAIRLIGGDGSPLIQGRDLVHRFALAAPFWVGILDKVPSTSATQLKQAATRIISYFLNHGVPDKQGLLNLGWFQSWPYLTQNCYGPSSSYWAINGLLGIALPDEHPVWATPEELLPVERQDQLFPITAPGWLVSTTHTDGLVRVFNHGSGPEQTEINQFESSLFGRIGYSSSTFPLLNESSWKNLGDNNVALCHRDGRLSSRSQIKTLSLTVIDGVGVAVSRYLANWMQLTTKINSERETCGDSQYAGIITLASIVRGPWEVRAFRTDYLSPAVREIRVSGWATDQMFSELLPLTKGLAHSTVHLDANPVADQVITQEIRLSPTIEWEAALVVLAGAQVSLAVVVEVYANQIFIRWPDDHTNQIDLPPPPERQTDN